MAQGLLCPVSYEAQLADGWYLGLSGLTRLVCPELLRAPVLLPTAPSFWGAASHRRVDGVFSRQRRSVELRISKPSPFGEGGFQLTGDARTLVIFAR